MTLEHKGEVMVSESGSITVHTDAALPVFLLTHTLVCSVVSSLSPVVREICFLALQIQFQDFFLLEGGSLFVCTRMCVSGCVPGQVLGRQTCWKWVKDAHTHIHTHLGVIMWCHLLGWSTALCG